MSMLANRIKRSFYLDSVALMRLSRELSDLSGIDDAALMMASETNKEILAAANMLDDAGRQAAANDLIIAVRGQQQASLVRALAQAETRLTAPKAANTGTTVKHRPRSVRGALKTNEHLNLALISVPGSYAAAEARKALRSGLNAMVFSDNVSIEQEIALKQEAAARDLLVMGPDCGTAIIDGVPLAFANKVPRGSIGIIGASGTGIQEVSCLIAHWGGGVSHAIGTGGRDLNDRVGGTTTHQALDRLQRDPATKTIVIISKPPGSTVAGSLVQRLHSIDKPIVLCFLGMPAMDVLPAHCQQAATLEEAALLALKTDGIAGQQPDAMHVDGQIMGLFAGGTLCAEAQFVLLEAGLSVASNAPIERATAWQPGGNHQAHSLIDLGADEFTAGRPHPMIEPYVRHDPLLAALNDPEIGIILLDCVLGYGSHQDPAGAIAETIKAGPETQPLIIASVTGTDADPQNAQKQAETLRSMGVLVAGSNAQAARLAVACHQ